MRKIMWFAIGFACACILRACILWELSVALLAGLSALILVVFFVFGSRNERFPIGTFILSGFCAGLLWSALFAHGYLRPIASLDGETVHLRITASDYSARSRYSMAFEGITVIDGKPYKTLVYQSDDSELQPGDVLESDFRIRLTTPGGIKESTYHQGNGLFLIASQKGETEIHRPGSVPLWCMPSVIARAVKENLQNCFPEDTAALAKALLLGDTDDLTYEEDTALKISGIRHVAAVSGLHVSLVFGVVYWLCRRRRKLTFLAAVPVLLVFAAVTGFTPSVVRACLMTGLMALGMAVKAEYDGLTSLSLAALIMLMLNPFAFYSVSMQLSVSSVAGILLFASPIYQWFRGCFPNVRAKSLSGNLVRWIGGSVSVSVSALLITTPLSAYYFSTVSLVGILTNLITIGPIGVAFGGIGIVGVFGGAVQGVCRILAQIISWILRYVLFAAGLLSKLPFAAVYTQSQFVVIWIVVCYVLIALFLLRRKHPGRYLLIGTSALILAIGLSISLPKLDDVRLTVLDVGEGQCILLQSGGSYYMIDCGGDTDTQAANTAAQTLLSQGIRHLDGFILTHYDYDHASAMQYLASRVDVAHFYLPDTADAGFARPLSPDISEKVIWISENTQLALNLGTLTLTEPGNLKTSNENCMCVLFESEKCDILITGDRSKSGEKRLIKSMELPHVDVLIAGHHGSKNSTSSELLEAVMPEIVIISVGKNNSYGHPAAEMLARLAEYGCTVYRTDLQGTILIRR